MSEGGVAAATGQQFDVRGRTERPKVESGGL